MKTYGFETMFTLDSLEKLGLLRREGKPVFPALRKMLHLAVEEVSEVNPTDIAYTYSGYTSSPT